MREIIDSGVEWLGDIPETWDLVQLGSLFSEHKHKNTGMQSNNLLSLSYGSGVEWIGKIAETHTIFRLKYLLDSPMQYGANESGDKFIEDSVRYIRITDITADGKLKNDENNQYLPLDAADGYILKDKDVLFARSGGTVGKSFLYHEDYLAL